MLIVWNINSSIVNISVDYQSMPLQCIVFSGLICSQHVIEMDLVSQKVPKILIPMIQVPYPYH